MLNKIIRKANRDDESNFRREEYESSLYFGNLGRNCNDKDIEEKNNILRNFFANNFTSTTDESKKIFDFSANVFQNCVKSASNSNLMVSPLSLLYALGMALNGADGETKHEIESVLGLSAGELNQVMQVYKQSLEEESTCRFKNANALWLKECEDISFYPDFIKINEKYYGASVFQEPFDETTVNKINSWVQEKTDGMVEGLLDSIQKDDKMYLLNALAFAAEWLYGFEEYETRDAIFTTQDGIEQTVKMMSSEENIYLEDDEAIGFIKLYSDPRFSFVALLPNESIGIEDYVSQLTGEKIVGILSNASRTQVDAEMPAFTSDSSIELKDILKCMGISEAFGDRADFSKIGKSREQEHGSEKTLAIDQMKQKTHISVDERGTKASAVTTIYFADTKCCTEVSRLVILDRPFVYMIIDHNINLPIFMGVLMNAGTEKL